MQQTLNRFEVFIKVNLNLKPEFSRRNEGKITIIYYFPELSAPLYNTFES